MRVGSRKQQGIALLVALVVLVVVSILGVTAMRLALFQNKVSINSQVAQHLFQGAETGLQGVSALMLSELVDGEHPLQDPAGSLARVVNGQVLRVCVDDAGVALVSGSANRTGPEAFQFQPCNAFAGNRLSVTSVLAPPPPDIPPVVAMEGYDINGNYVLQQVYSRSYAGIGGIRARASHVQMWGVRSVNPE
ncbi:MAG: PilX N-terminal domain-containing pilus assembly protein [Gammaproteobacteria bacterium]